MAASYKILSWGMCTIFVRLLGGKGKWIKFPIPVENSTQLTPTKGDKQEAKIEGGDVEAVRYSKNTYALEANVRIAPQQPKPVIDHDGVIDGSWEVVVVPELEGAIGIKLDNSTLSAGPTFTAADGIIQEYTFDAVKPESGDTVKFGTVKVTGGDESDYEIEFTEMTAEE